MINKARAGNTRNIRQLAALSILAFLLISQSAWAADLQGLLERGRKRYKAGDYLSALQLCQQGLNESLGAEDSKYQALFYRCLGNIHHLSSEQMKAIADYQKAIEVCQAIDDREDKAITLINLGSVYEGLGYWIKGIETQRQALGLAQQIDDRVLETRSLRGIGGAYYLKGDYPNAIDAYKQALSINSKAGDPQIQTQILTTIGFNYLLMDDYSNALVYSLRALPAARSAGNALLEKTIVTNIGTIYMKRGEDSKAADYLTKALELNRRIKANPDAAIVRAPQGEFDSDRRKANDGVEELSLIRNLAKVYRELGNMQEAHDYDRRANDSAKGVLEQLTQDLKKCTEDDSRISVLTELSKFDGLPPETLFAVGESIKRIMLVTRRPRSAAVQISGPLSSGGRNTIALNNKGEQVASVFQQGNAHQTVIRIAPKSPVPEQFLKIVATLIQNNPGWAADMLTNGDPDIALAVSSAQRWAALNPHIMTPGLIAASSGSVTGVQKAVSTNEVLHASAETQPQISIRTPEFPDWTPRAPIPIVRTYMAAAAIGNIIYVVIGDGRTGAVDSILEAYDTVTDTWAQKASLPVISQSRNACALDGTLYVLAGKRHKQELFAYDSKKDSWTSKGAVPYSDPLHPDEVCMGNFDGQIYILSDEIYSYDPVQNTWTAIEYPMPPRLERGKPVMVQDKIYTLGATLKSLRFGDLEWATLTQTDEPITGADFVAVGSHIYALGGYELPPGGLKSGNQEIHSLMEVLDYDTESNAWTPKQPFNFNRSGFAAASVNGTLYVIGGFDRPTGAANFSCKDQICRRMMSAYTPGSAAQPKSVAKLPESKSYIRNSDITPRAKRSDDFALVIGLDDYRSLPRARGGERDAESISTYLQNGLGLSKDNVVILTKDQASRADIASYIDEWLPKNLSPDSRLYFYFAGQGAVDSTNQKAYLLPWDADLSFLPSSAYPLDRLFERIQAMKMRDAILIFDCCFGRDADRCREAHGLRPLMNTMDPGPGRRSRLTVLFATSGHESAGVLPDDDRGLFTNALLHGLLGAAEKRGSGVLTVEDLFTYVRTEVGKGAVDQRQTPRLYTPNPDVRIY